MTNLGVVTFSQGLTGVTGVGLCPNCGQVRQFFVPGELISDGVGVIFDWTCKDKLYMATMPPEHDLPYEAPIVDQSRQLKANLN